MLLNIEEKNAEFFVSSFMVVGGGGIFKTNTLYKSCFHFEFQISINFQRRIIAKQTT